MIRRHLEHVQEEVLRRGDAGYAINDLRAFSVVFA